MRLCTYTWWCEVVAWATEQWPHLGVPERGSECCIDTPLSTRVGCCMCMCVCTCVRAMPVLAAQTRGDVVGGGQHQPSVPDQDGNAVAVGDMLVHISANTAIRGRWTLAANSVQPSRLRAATRVSPGRRLCSNATLDPSAIASRSNQETRALDPFQCRHVRIHQDDHCSASCRSRIACSPTSLQGKPRDLLGICVHSM